ncbi:heme/hemin ABC transporter substrate-binding protein [Corynebacterium sp. 335C]
MPITFLRRGGVVAALLLVIVLAGALAGCTPPDRTAAPTATVEGASGHVSADLPSENPEVLVENPQPQLPVTVTGADGETQTVESVDRIVALDRAGALSRMVWSLGLGDRLVGRDIASDFPGVEHLPELAPGGHAVNPETVMSLQPDLILTDSTVGPSKAMDGFRAAGIPVVYVSDDRTIDTVGELVDEIAAATGLGHEAAGVREAVETDIAEASERAQAKSDGRRMMMLYLRGTTTAMIAGEGTGAGELITALGGVDAAADSGAGDGFTPLTPEALVAAAPDTVIVMTGGLESIGGIDGMMELPGFAQTPAGAARSVIDVPDSQLLSFGPQTGRVIDAMADALFGDAG